MILWYLFKKADLGDIFYRPRSKIVISNRNHRPGAPDHKGTLPLDLKVAGARDPSLINISKPMVIYLSIYLIWLVWFMAYNSMGKTSGNPWIGMGKMNGILYGKKMNGKIHLEPRPLKKWVGQTHSIRKYQTAAWCNYPIRLTYSREMCNN